jgi:uncharacterized protein YrzB (UPF0473 family)
VADLEKDDLTELDEEPVVVMTDEDGNEYYYREEMIIPVGEKRYAILVPIDIEDECDCGHDHSAEDECDCDDIDVFIARIDIDEDGEEIYVDPTDEEFEEVTKAYEKMMAEEDEAE